MYIFHAWYVLDFVGLTIVFLLIYLFFVGSIRVALANLHNRETLTKCVRLPKKIKCFLFLSLRFSSEEEIFPIHTIMLTSLIHLGCIFTAALEVAARQFTLPEWANSVGRWALTVAFFAWVIEMLTLGADESSQKPPRPPKLKL